MRIRMQVSPTSTFCVEICSWVDFEALSDRKLLNSVRSIHELGYNSSVLLYMRFLGSKM